MQMDRAGHTLWPLLGLIPDLGAEVDVRKYQIQSVMGAGFTSKSQRHTASLSATCDCKYFPSSLRGPSEMLYEPACLLTPPSQLLQPSRCPRGSQQRGRECRVAQPVPTPAGPSCPLAVSTYTFPDS